MINIENECEGWFSFSAFRVDSSGNEIPGTRRKPVPPFRNLITNGGLDRMGDNADWMNWCQVGSGSSVPVATDTGLVTRIAGSNTQQAFTTSAQTSAPFYLASVKTFRFAAGVAAGNISEVGIGWASAGSLFSRALIRDGLGNPTTITVLADELLDVTYEFRQYPPSVDSSATINLRGVDYTYTGRAIAVNSFTPGQSWGWVAAGASAGQTTQLSSLRSAYPGPIGSVTANIPSGTPSPSDSQTALAYSAGSYAREHVIFWGNSSGNIVDGIGAIRLVMGIGAYQFGFSPKIPKTSDDTLSLTFRHSWARRP